MLSPRPSVSVIIATYNWSTALRCAIRSVLLQTLQTFEILVIGDACTDDSAAVVAAFNDPRIRWRNLDRHYGSQWAPNNLGLEIAAADYIAYLGHDDIWYPTHLASCLRSARERHADLVASTMILYGPPDTHARSVSGLFTEDTCSAMDFMPPSSILHHKSLIGRCGPWKDAASTVLPVDCEFVKGAFKCGARIAPTNELTVFKFNAAWRRDAYKRRTVAEQEAKLQQIEAGVDFRGAELTDVLRAGAEGLLGFLKMPDNPDWAAGEKSRQYRVFKGAEPPFTPAQLRRLEKTERFGLGDQFAGFEWHGEEQDQVFGSFRWSGPSNVSTVDLPVMIDRELLVRVHVLHAIDETTLQKVAITVNGRRIEGQYSAMLDGTCVIAGSVCPGEEGADTCGLRLTIELERTKRPRDLGINDDSRLLGLAVNWIEVEPVQAS